MLGGLGAVDDLLDLFDELAEEVACHFAGFAQVVDLFCVFNHKALIKEIESLHLGMPLGLQVFREFFSDLTCLGITEDHAHFGRGSGSV